MRADGIKKLNSLDIRGKFGRGGGFGRVAFAYNFFGFYSEFSGIYSRKYYFGKAYISKMKFYRPTNPRTAPQQSWRGVFADGMAEWSSLDSLEKKSWNSLGRLYRMSGMNFFLRSYLINHS